MLTTAEAEVTVRLAGDVELEGLVEEVGENRGGGFLHERDEGVARIGVPEPVERFRPEVAGGRSERTADLIAEPSQFNVVTDYGTTNLRTLGAPTLSLAVITAIGAFRREWLLLLPAAMYFAFNLTARVTSVFVEGYESDMLRGLLFTGTLAILAQIALHTFRTSEEPAVALAA